MNLIPCWLMNPIPIKNSIFIMTNVLKDGIEACSSVRCLEKAQRCWEKGGEHKRHLPFCLRCL